MALSRRARSHRGLSSCAISDFVLSGGASVSIRANLLALRLCGLGTVRRVQRHMAGAAPAGALRANLLGVRRKGDRALWHYTWCVDCPQTPYEMPAARWLGLGSVTSDALRKRS